MHTVINNGLAIGHKGKQNRVKQQFLKLIKREKTTWNDEASQ